MTGILKKLGGRGNAKTTWELRKFSLSEKNLTWSSVKYVSGLAANDIVAVSKAESVEGKPSFVIMTSVKSGQTAGKDETPSNGTLLKASTGKRYHLIAVSEEERDRWVSIVQAIVDGALADVRPPYHS